MTRCGSINSELGAVPQGEAVRDDFDARSASDRDLEIHVGEPDVASDLRAGLAAHPRYSMLKGQGPGG